MADNIKQLTIEHYDDIIRIWADAGLPWRPQGRDAREKIAREITRDDTVFLGLFENRRMIAAGMAIYDGRKGWINRVAVDPDHRGRGLGGKMIAACERFLKQRGATVIGCLIEEHNLPSMALFQKHGYCFYEGVMYFSKRDSEES